jgi:hypothetical protein
MTVLAPVNGTGEWDHKPLLYCKIIYLMDVLTTVPVEFSYSWIYSVDTLLECGFL